MEVTDKEFREKLATLIKENWKAKQILEFAGGDFLDLDERQQKNVLEIYGRF